MATYRIDLDLLEDAKSEYENAEVKIQEDIETARTVVTNLTTDIYSGEDADTFRSEFTGYIDEDMTNLLGCVRAIRTILENGLDDGRGCKKYCNDFASVLGGSTSGISKDATGGELFCDQDVIVSMKDTCKEAVAYAESIEVGADSIDNILSGLSTVSLDSTVYTDSIRKGCEKVKRLEDFSTALTTYASGVESMNDYLKIGLDNCVPSEVRNYYHLNNSLLTVDAPQEDISEIEERTVAYWNRDDGYFDGEWWLDENKKNEAARMLLYDNMIRKQSATTVSGLNPFEEYTGMENLSPKEQAMMITLMMMLDGDGESGQTGSAESIYTTETWQEWLDKGVDSLMDTGFGDVLTEMETYAYMNSPVISKACQLYILLSGKDREEAVEDIREFSRGSAGGIIKITGEMFFGSLTIGDSLEGLYELYQEYGLKEGLGVLATSVVEGIKNTWEEDIVNGDARSRGEVAARLEAEILLTFAGAKAAKGIKNTGTKTSLKDAIKKAVNKIAQKMGKETKEAATDITKIVKEGVESATDKADDVTSDVAAKGLGKGGTDVIKPNRIPDNNSTIGHIFRDAEGHIPDTPGNRALLENVANNVDNFRGKDKYGNEWYTMDLEDGSQVWVEVRNGNIFEGGINKAPKPWDPDTGLKKP